MCKTIGIYSDKGINRKLYAWLIAMAAEDIIRGNPYQSYESRRDCALCNLEYIGSTDHIILDSFGDNILDQIKLFNSNLQMLNLHDEQIKQTTYVQISTMKVFHEDELEKNNLSKITLDQIQDMNPFHLEDNWVMNIHNYIFYFADFVMKKYFGCNVWLNSVIASNSFIGDNDYKIYWDVKTQDELNYIKSCGGKIISIIDNKKKIKGGYRKIKSLSPDMILDISNDDMDEISKTIFEIAKLILNH